MGDGEEVGSPKTQIQGFSRGKCEESEFPALTENLGSPPSSGLPRSDAHFTPLHTTLLYQTLSH